MAAASETTVRRRVTIVNGRGLHARAAAKFVKLVGSFQSTVTVSKDGNSVSGDSIMGLMMLAASPGCRISVSATGPEAKKALDALETLIANRFGEEN